MAINTLATATLFMTQLDKIAVQEATTGWMDANAGQVIYNGGSEVKIPKMSVQGMGDYDREAGYQRGSVTLEYETRKMTQDRGRLFQLDPMDINEANFIPTAGAVMGEFQRTQVVPEIDAYRISKLATETLTADKAGMIGESYVPGTASTSALRKLKEGIKAVRENYNGALICQATPDFIMELELELAGKIIAVTFSKGGIQTQVPSVDGVPLVSTPSNRMYTAIKINNGKDSGQEKGGYEKGTSAKNLNFFICPVTTPIAVTKQDIMRIFDPTTNQKLNAWQMDYRRFHDMWILDNKLDSIHSPSTVMRTQGGYVISGLFNGMKAGLPAVLSWIAKLPGQTKERLGNAKTWLRGKGNAAITGLKNGWEAVRESTFLSRVKKIASQSFNAIGDIKSKVTPKGRDIISGMRTGLNNNWSSLSGILSNIPGKVANAIPSLYTVGQNVIQTFANGFSSIHIPMPHINWDWEGGSIKIGNFKFSLPRFNLSWYANGGFPGMGEMFVARESGPELVGRMGNRSAVANNNQIIAGIRAGVFEAVVNAFESMQGRNDRGQELHIYLEGDAKKLFKVIRQEGNNYQKQTGNPVFG